MNPPQRDLYFERNRSIHERFMKICGNTRETPFLKKDNFSKFLETKSVRFKTVYLVLMFNWQLRKWQNIY